jgi:hypothetical protein
MISEGRLVLAPDAGAGCKNVDVSAFPVFRGVKCCCRVENAGCDASGSSVLETASVAGPPVVVSDFGLTIVVRVNPASLADALGAAGGGIAEAPFNRKLLEPIRDLGLAVAPSALLTSLRRCEVLLVDCVRL